MVPPSSDQVSRVWPYSGTRAALAVFAYVSLTLSGWLSHTIRLTAWVLKAVRTPEGFLLPVCPLPRSLATTNGISVDVSSSPYLDVSVQAEFPHSEIPGSKDVCSSPRLIAAYHVFHRLPVPRHSPCALCSLTVVYLSINISLFRFSICQRDFTMFRNFFEEKIPEASYVAELIPLNQWRLPLGEIIDFI